MVYRNGAELTHSATARLEKGNNQLVITDVSNAIDASSIRIKCSASVTVLSVAVSTDYLIEEAASPVVRRLQDSIGAIEKELSRLAVMTKTDNEMLELLGSNKSIGGSTSGVSVAELAKMMDYYRQKSIELRTELSGFADKATHWKEVREKLKAQIQEEEKKNSRTGGALVLQLMSPTAGPCDFTVSYLTMAAYWQPSYDLKAGGGTDSLHLLYKANLVQTSGIDWRRVKLSLSTAMPTQSGNAPILQAWFLRFVEPVAAGYFLNSAQPSNSVAANAPTIMLRGTQSLKEAALPMYVVDGKIMSEAEFKTIDSRAIKSINVLKGEAATAIYGSRAANGVIQIMMKDEPGDYVSLNEQQMDAVFDIDIPYDVAGNGKEQSVELKDYRLPCTYQYYAAPRADRDAYLLGQVTGWEKLNLLPGEASIMVDGTYIGKSNIDPGSLQDTLNLTLGKDKRIVIKKEKVTDFSSVKFLGSNKKQVFTYEITVRNNKKEKASLTLKDQYPISTDKEIESELLESSGATVNTDTGILTWKVELAPGESRKLRISYSVKYPKDKSISMN
jgi:TonB-dependent SusC/RagA subfamily outer membrane receptor